MAHWKRTSCKHERVQETPRAPVNALALLQEYYGHAVQRSAHFRKVAESWNVVHYILGLSATALAAMSGLGFLGDIIGSALAGWLAVASAVAGATANFLASGRRTSELRRLSGDWLAFADRCSSSIIELEGTTIDHQGNWRARAMELVHDRQAEREPLLQRQPLPSRTTNQ